jgi:hypothetical protein
MKYADNYMGANSSTTGLVYLGFRARTREARLCKYLSPCRLEEESDGRTTPRYECLGWPLVE